jgi:hypothetical protein
VVLIAIFGIDHAREYATGPVDWRRLGETPGSMVSIGNLKYVLL